MQYITMVKAGFLITYILNIMCYNNPMMNIRGLLLILSTVFIAAGCAQEKKPPATQVMNKEKGEAMQKANLINEIPTEPEMKEGRLVPPLSVSRENLEDIILSHSWGFSVFDPRSETIDYYTSTGRFLGRVSL